MTQNELSAIVKGIGAAVFLQLSKSIEQSLESFDARIGAMEQRVASLRDGTDGLPGQPGEAGPAGVPGERGPEGAPGRDADDEVLVSLQEQITALSTVIVTAKAMPGRDGRDGLPGIPGPAGEKGADGLNGKDGAPGLNGTLDALEVKQSEDSRTVQLCFKATGEPIQGGVLTFPVVLDRGVYKAGMDYAAGDGVTWAGSFWIAQKATSEKPGEGQTGWRLAVKRGGDGKPGDKGEPGINGKDGAPGRDGNRTW